MVLGSPIALAVCFVLINVIFSIHAESEFPSQNHNATDHTPSWKRRSKRSLFDKMPLQLKMTIMSATGEKIDLTYRKTSPYLANEHLPVIAPHIGLDSNVKKDIGEFVFYHDIVKCSAVVYFETFKTLYGIVGINHYIQDLPFNFNQDGDYQLGVVGQPYVKKYDHPFNHIHPGMVYPPPSDSDAWYNFLRQTTHESNRSPDCSFDCDSKPKRPRNQQDVSNSGRSDGANANTCQVFTGQKRQRKPKHREYIVETVVIVTRDIADNFEKFFGKDQHIEWIVRYLIIYFNAVDMMFKKIEPQHAAIYMNIAKIVVESDLKPFTDFIGDGDLQFTDIIEKLPQYLYSHRQEYAEDSFDHIFIYTSRPIFDGTIQVNGLTKSGQDLYEARKKGQFYDVVPITVVQFQYHYADYAVAVHEIGRLFDMKIEPQERGLQAMGQCLGVMQREGSKCNYCLKWSEGSRSQLQTFFEKNRNRCFLLNKPRSLRSDGASVLISYSTQCQCFGYKNARMSPTGYVMNAVKINGCMKPLECQSDDKLQPILDPIVWPFDGTQCSSNKVCWGKECVPITYD